MKIRIPADKFDNLKDFIRMAEEHNSKGIILDSKQGYFERVKNEENETGRSEVTG